MNPQQNQKRTSTNSPIVGSSISPTTISPESPLTTSILTPLPTTPTTARLESTKSDKSTDWYTWYLNNLDEFVEKHPNHVGKDCIVVNGGIILLDELLQPETSNSWAKEMFSTLPQDYRILQFGKLSERVDSSSARAVLNGTFDVPKSLKENFAWLIVNYDSLMESHHEKIGMFCVVTVSRSFAKIDFQSDDWQFHYDEAYNNKVHNVIFLSSQNVSQAFEEAEKKKVPDGSLIFRFGQLDKVESAQFTRYFDDIIETSLDTRSIHLYVDQQDYGLTNCIVDNGCEITTLFSYETINFNRPSLIFGISTSQTASGQTKTLLVHGCRVIVPQLGKIFGPGHSVLISIAFDDYFLWLISGQLKNQYNQDQRPNKRFFIPFMASETFKTWVKNDKFEDASSDLKILFRNNGVLQRGWNPNKTHHGLIGMNYLKNVELTKAKGSMKFVIVEDQETKK